MGSKARAIIWIAVVLATAVCAMYALGIIAIPVRISESDGYGDVYSGKIVRGDFEGSVKIEYADGAVWEGPLNNGQFDGNGVYSSPDGWKFAGEFKDGEIAGNGSFEFPDGSFYEVER
jgi:hypothetical protein